MPPRASFFLTLITHVHPERRRAGCAVCPWVRPGALRLAACSSRRGSNRPYKRYLHDRLFCAPRDSLLRRRAAARRSCTRRRRGAGGATCKLEAAETTCLVCKFSSASTGEPQGGSGQRARPRAPPRVCPRLYLRDVAKRSLVREQAYALRLRERGRGARAACGCARPPQGRTPRHIIGTTKTWGHPIPTARGTLQACALRRSGDPRQRPARRLHISGRSPSRSRPGCSRHQRPSRPRCRPCPPGKRP